MHYAWKLNNAPQTCNCGAQFTVDHVKICHMGGFPTIRHNEIRDITASLLTEVCIYACIVFVFADVCVYVCVHACVHVWVKLEGSLLSMVHKMTFIETAEYRNTTWTY